ncbi:unnamed protein product [Litomosoides sigmodontis]|uniref:SAM-dependent methyltransferase Erg6/SMT-type domain-containing protein n=1 Tax=Litomosoides sigmodontis TaxID=42156 RepID=A0A3P6RX87_LITSI|nr:unnamed protein product [Litomosoides sigmodontis]
MVATKVPHSGGLVVLSPLVQGPEHNVVLISRGTDVECNRILHVAGGEHTGIVINKLIDGKPNLKCDVALNFSVWLRNGDMQKQENRCFRFRFFDDTEVSNKHATAQQFFRDLVSVFPRDYVTFLKRILKLMQNDYGAVREIEIDMQFAKENEAYKMPDPKQYDSGSEVENVTAGHVQEVLEHAYPNGLSVDIIAESLRCTNKEVNEFLSELEALGVVQKLQDEWIRVSAVDSIELSRTQSSFGPRDHPTVAILTCLFTEKQSIDAIIDNSTTVHRYRSGGDSNIYTLGWIGKHRVVATKLAVIGDSREATTSAGSITTRLLGNFQHVEHVFVVGVGGGVAHYTDATRHVRLGDVVVSGPDPNAYVFAHSYIVDRTTERVNGFLVRNWNPQDAIIAHIAKNMDDKMITEWNSITEATIDHLDTTNGDMSFSRPPPQSDLLAVPVGNGQVVVIPHPNSERVNSVVHFGSIGAMVSYRKQTLANEEQTGEDTSSCTTQLRDKFAANHNLRAVDAGFDSVIAAISGSRIDSWALIRGIADYQHGQSRASRTWQEVFAEEHDRLYKEAKAKSDYSLVTAHYYSVMSAIIDEYFNGSFHFAPPRRRQQSLADALKELHERIGRCLKLTRGKQCVDIGCGIGGVMHDLAITGASLTGVTIAGNEVTVGNERFENEGLKNCRIVQGNCCSLPLVDGGYDCAYAVYALKYIEDLKPALQEVNRILLPGGLFLVYDLLKTDKYHSSSEKHKEVIKNLEYACGMPPLHTKAEIIGTAKIYGLELVENIDFDRETGNPFYFCFSNSPLFMWLVSSSLVDWIISIAQTFHVMPKGFLHFKRIFLAGTINSIVQAGKLGILSGSEILLFQKIK